MVCLVLSFQKCQISGQGKENVKIYLKEHQDLYNELEQKVREHYGFDDKKTTLKEEE